MNLATVSIPASTIGVAGNGIYSFSSTSGQKTAENKEKPLKKVIEGAAADFFKVQTTFTRFLPCHRLHWPRPQMLVQTELFA
jgi:hypothetical protein